MISPSHLLAHLMPVTGGGGGGGDRRPNGASRPGLATAKCPLCFAAGSDPARRRDTDPPLYPIPEICSHYHPPSEPRFPHVENKDEYGAPCRVSTKITRSPRKDYGSG